MTPTSCADIRDPARLAALEQTGLLGTASEPAFDRLTRLTAQVLSSPMVIILLVDDEHVFFKSSYGLPEPLASRRQAPLSHSFCQIVAAAGAPLIVPDTRLDVQLQDDTAIRELGIVAYAGAPLVMPDGHTLGALCALDRQPRAWSSHDIHLLRDMAAAVVDELQLRRTVAELRHCEAQLLQLQKAETIGLLASGIIHDFNNLLTAIVGYAELGLRDLPRASPLRNDLTEIEKATNRANSLTRQLLAFLRKQPIEPCVFDLNALMFDMGKLLRRLMRENIKLVVLPAQEHSHVRADPGQISQVLLNLAVNARDAMPDGGTLTIATAIVQRDCDRVERQVEASAGVYVMLAVSDTGIGMPEETRAHLFEPFFTTKAQGQGTGLGLATCQNIVRRYGGRICISSNVGQGTTIQIYLPRVDGGQAEQSCCAEPQAMPSGTETVLLAEDEAVVRTMIADGLRGLGYTVLEAANGDEALGVVCGYQGVVNLLLADVVMPHTGGGVLAERLRARYPALAVLLISGYLDCNTAQAMEQSLGAAFLQKPFTLTTLTRKVRDVLDRCSGAAAEER